LSEDQFWAKPYRYGNSIGHLTLHLIGNLNYFIGAQIAKTDYVRDRDREFTESATPPKVAVLQRLDEVVELLIRTLGEQTAADWVSNYEAESSPDFVTDRFAVFLRCATHLHHHVGQMIYLEKEIKRSE
jgi:hypothetical protein